MKPASPLAFCSRSSSPRPPPPITPSTRIRPQQASDAEGGGDQGGLGNPHIWVFMDVKDETGKVTNWAWKAARPTPCSATGGGRTR